MKISYVCTAAMPETSYGYIWRQVFLAENDCSHRKLNLEMVRSYLDSGAVATGIAYVLFRAD